jgi:hypothetical protein
VPSPVPVAPAPALVAAVHNLPMCDRCHVATAQWEIRVGEVGYVYLCSHHANVHAHYVAQMGYGFRELTKA